MFSLSNVTLYRIYNSLIMLFIVGHGKSDGDRVHIEDFQIYVRDVIQHIEMLKAEYGNIPFFLLGHSKVSQTKN